MESPTIYIFTLTLYAQSVNRFVKNFPVMTKMKRGERIFFFRVAADAVRE
jgi:hypothetical protein